MRNIHLTVEIETTCYVGEKPAKQTLEHDYYTMAPNAGDLQVELREWEIGRKAATQEAANTAYWLFVCLMSGHDIERTLIAPIAHKHDRARRQTVIESDSHRLTLWLTAV